MKTKNILIVSLISLTLSSCEILTEVSKQIDTSNLPTIAAPLTEQEVVRGLKEALKIGTDSSVTKVSKTNGFFGNAALKILLPPEAKIITDNMDNPILKAVGISKMVDDVILRMNRSAEAAAAKAGPIFLTAISNMSITDAFGILKGGDTAATHFFRITTYNALYQSFNPIIKSYLDQKLVGNISANEAWSTLTTAYNKAAKLSSTLKPVNTNLEDYVTKKTINGVFIKLAEEELQIRKDPMARVTDILKRVFGS